MVEKIIIFFIIGNLEGILISDWWHAKRDNKALKNSLTVEPTILAKEEPQDLIDIWAGQEGDEPLKITKKIKVK